ncbi:MAG TPA: pentapeptide repeat-containing protein, partial [Methylomirabilota bacterium]|nr:pentapeptide repeat-containing protein [Methylomirabilota bacterium]
NKRDDWRNYWNELGQPWRTEPEIDVARQEELTDLRLTLLDIDGTDEGSFYIFGKDVELTRADIEWLLATHEQEQKVIGESDKSQQYYKGLDLRGVNLHGKDLRGLPMKSINLHKANLEEADLSDAHLEEANLSRANLKRAKLYSAHLENTDLDGACLEQAQLTGAYLGGVHGGLNPTNIKSALLNTAHLEGASFLWVDMERSFLTEAHLEGASLLEANLKGANLAEAHLEGADLSDAHLEGASLKKAYLHGANLSNAHLERANLSEAHLEGKNMHDDIWQAVQQWEKDFPKELLPANLSGAFFDNTTNLKGAIFGNTQFGAISLADVHLGDVSLSVVDWKPIRTLGDERKAHQIKEKDGNWKVSKDQIDAYETATRANRQLAVALQDQGLNEKASFFAYRAQLNQRHLLKLHVLEDLERMPKLRLLTFKPDSQLNIIRLVILSILIISLAFFFTVIYFTVKGMMNFEFSRFINDLTGSDLYLLTVISSMILCLTYLIIFKISFRLFLFFSIVPLMFFIFLYFLFLLLLFILQNSGFIISLFFLVIFFAALVFVVTFAALVINQLKAKGNNGSNKPNLSIHNNLDIYSLINSYVLNNKKFSKLSNWIKTHIRSFNSLIKPFAVMEANYGRYIFSTFL